MDLSSLITTWQDAAMAAANIIFIIGLIPTLRRAEQKPPVSTSIWITFGMTLMVIADYSLEQYWSTFFMTVNTVQWIVLALQRRALDRLALEAKNKKGSL